MPSVFVWQALTRPGSDLTLKKPCQRQSVGSANLTPRVLIDLRRQAVEGVAILRRIELNRKLLEPGRDHTPIEAIDVGLKEAREALGGYAN